MDKYFPNSLYSYSIEVLDNIDFVIVVWKTSSNSIMVIFHWKYNYPIFYQLKIDKRFLYFWDFLLATFAFSLLSKKWVDSIRDVFNI